MLKEIHHRVKNNMQIVSSLLFLQAQRTSSPEVLSVIRESQDRIRTMGLIHENLYTSGTLTLHLATSYACTDKVNFKIEAAGITLPVDIAIPCGLMINELLTNTLKHAFPEGSGEVNIRIGLAGELVVISFQDSGVGLPVEQEQEGKAKTRWV